MLFDSPLSLSLSLALSVWSSLLNLLHSHHFFSPSCPNHQQKIMSFCVFVFFSFFFIAMSLSSSTTPPTTSPYDTTISTSYRIDCGGQTNFTTGNNHTWLSDRFFTGGAQALVSEPHRFSLKQEQTLRFFPISFGKKNCYILNVRAGRYYFRTFTVYDNYDGKLRSPSFDVAVEGTVVFPWRSPWPEDVSRSGAYSDLLAFVDDGEADVCFYGIATDAPVIGSLEVLEVDRLAYDSPSTGGVILVNYGRLSCGSESFGLGSTSHVDRFGRAWQSDRKFRVNSSGIKALGTTKYVRGTNQRPNYFPTRLYQTAVTVVGSKGAASSAALEYRLAVDAKLDYLVWFHFVEIDVSVNAVGKRVFDVVINGVNVKRIDIFKEVGGFSALNWHYNVKNLNNSVLSVKLVPVVGAPIISGLENYALVPRDLSTVPDQVVAMRALKESLRIPGRMGWNGDPCAPSVWDAWEGVTCHPNKDKTALVVSQIDLGSQGLKGYISGQIARLVDLVSLNLSSNFLEGTLPPGLAQKSLIRLDLSNNQLSGLIPDSLASSNRQLVLLNGNKLEGQVPEELYSIGVHGGEIDLSGNKGLCGVPSLPACPLFWGKGGLSTGGKIAIGLISLFVLISLLVLIYILYVRRGRSEYEFGPPQDLISIAAKRNRYQRQKSLMLLEMETQSHERFPTTLNPL